MEQDLRMELLVMEKKRYGKLAELSELTNQLAEAVDRQDSISANLLLSMRKEPIAGLVELDACIKAGCAHRSARLNAILEGAAAAEPDEKPLADQIAANRRLLERVAALDERINRKISGEKSVYAKPYNSR